MTREEFAAALSALGMTQTEFARRLAELSGLNVLPSHVSRWCSRASTGRDPSPAACVAARLMLEAQETDRLVRAVERAGWKRSK